jgi:hypothetical protein
MDRHVARCFSSALKPLLNIVADQLNEHILKTFMKDGATPIVHHRVARAPVLMSVLLKLLEDGKAEANDPFVGLC